MDYEVLNILEFNSTRKRMSVIVRDSTGKLYIFCKVSVGPTRGDPLGPTLSSSFKIDIYVFLPLPSYNARASLPHLT